jgi:hypothetical protein
MPLYLPLKMTLDKKEAPRFRRIVNLQITLLKLGLLLARFVCGDHEIQTKPNYSLPWSSASTEDRSKQ